MSYCPEATPCAAAALCSVCFARELLAKRGPAGAIGQVWAERVARAGYGDRQAWPAGEERTLGIARRLVAALAQDERLLEELALVADGAAAAWWERRPERYRR